MKIENISIDGINIKPLKLNITSRWTILDHTEVYKMKRTEINYTFVVVVKKYIKVGSHQVNEDVRDLEVLGMLEAI